MVSRNIGSWLVALADPQGQYLHLPSCRLRRSEVAELFQFADWHGVLPAVTQNFRQLLLSSAPQQLLHDTDLSHARAETDIALAHADQRLRQMSGFGLLLRAKLVTIGRALAERDIAATLLRGTDFADRLYPYAGLRTFRDIDILVPKDTLSDAEQVLQELGYQIQGEPPKKYPTDDYAERSWRLQEKPLWNVELHWNVVNVPSIGRAVSVQYEDLIFQEQASKADGFLKLCPSSLLLTAAVHAAASHCFDRLQLLCDLRQLLRGSAGPIDEDWLISASRRTGSTLAIATALHLVQRTFGESKPRGLFNCSRAGLAAALARFLLTPEVVVFSQKTAYTMRRCWFRELLKRHASAKRGLGYRD